MKTITLKQALNLKNKVFLDVRTPKEFQEDHLPEAINLPILNNQERAVVGTLYKQVSQKQALKEGAKFYAQRLPLLTKKIAKYKNKKLVVYCWRGGLRSKAPAALFHSLGYQTYRLEGGYKSYRKYVLEQLTNYHLKPKLVVLHGLTCSGKTKLLQLFPNSLDLEGLAQHRGSLFGSLGLKPNSQKRFDSLLLQKLNQLQGGERQLASEHSSSSSDKLGLSSSRANALTLGKCERAHPRHIFVEGESRKIGNTQIPAFFWQAMKQGIQVLVTASLKTRIKNTVEEYFTPENILKIKEITQSLNKVISKQNQQQVLDHINSKNYSEAAKLLLTKYYDPLYQHSLKKINYDFEIDNNNLAKAIKELKDKIKNLIFFH